MCCNGCQVLCHNLLVSLCLHDHHQRDVVSPEAFRSMKEWGAASQASSLWADVDVD